MTLVAPDVCRYTMNGTLQGFEVVNILDMVVDPSGIVIAGRTAAIEHVAGVLLDHWVDDILGALTDNYQFVSVSWVDLNTADGITGEITSTDDNTLPQYGGGEGDPLPSNVAMLVKKITTSARGQRGGRWYLANPGEQQTEASLINNDFLDTVQGQLDTYNEGITDTGELADYPRFPTVVHTHNDGTPEDPDIVYTGNSQIHTFQLQRLLATQRRRMRK